MSGDADLTPLLSERVRAAHESRTALRIVGGDTKSWYGRPVEGEPLAAGGHRGILDHQPSELVITARAGTPLVEIEAALAQRGQHLPFEPLLTGEGATLGGAIATGMAGAARPFAGAPRDFVLGVTILDGRGRRLRFGGTVFKNVAGFDLFRPMCGALGTLGVLLDISLRLAPRPAATAFRRLDVGWRHTSSCLAAASRHPTVTGATSGGDSVRVRLAGPPAGVARDAAAIGGMDDDPAWWDRLRRLDVAPLTAPRLWRLALPRGRPPMFPPGDKLADWSGGLIWLASEPPHPNIRRTAESAGVHATLFRGARDGESVFSPLPSQLMAIHRRLKGALDPLGIFNPGRIYPDL